MDSHFPSIKVNLPKNSHNERSPKNAKRPKKLLEEFPNVNKSKIYKNINLDIESSLTKNIKNY